MGRFTGAAFVIAATVLIICALAVLDHWFKQTFSFSGAVALIGACVAVAVNAMLFIMVVKDGDEVSFGNPVLSKDTIYRRHT